MSSQTSVRLTPEERRMLRDIQDELGCNRSDAIRSLIRRGAGKGVPVRVIDRMRELRDELDAQLDRLEES